FAIGTNSRTHLFSPTKAGRLPSLLYLSRNATRPARGSNAKPVPVNFRALRKPTTRHDLPIFGARRGASQSALKRACTPAASDSAGSHSGDRLRLRGCQRSRSAVL